MKICVYGAGAIGGALAVRLKLAGQDVAVIARGEHGRAIRERGLTLVAGDRRDTVLVPCVSDGAELQQVPDLVFVTVKQTQLPSIAARLRQMAQGGARIVLAMNGIPWWFAQELPLPPGSALLDEIDPGRVLRDTLGPARLISAVVQSSNEVIEPGVVLGTTPKRNRLILGSVSRGPADPLVARIAEVLRAAGYEAIEAQDIRYEIWNKMALWMAVSPIAAVTGLSLDRLVSDEGGYAVMCGVMRDMIRLGRAVGFHLPADVEEKVGFYRDKPTRPSLLKDFELGRTPELASCVVIFDAIAKAAGVAVPHLQTLVAITRLRMATGTMC